MMELLLLLTLHPASAHRPHDVVVALAVPPDFYVTGVGWQSMDPHDISTLQVTTDFGRHWDYFASPVQDDIIVDAAATEDLVMFLAEDGTLWVSDDDAASWLDLELPETTEGANAVAAEGDTLAVATREGLWVSEGADLSGATLVIEDDGVKDVAFAGDDPDHMAAVTRGGALYRSTDGGARFTLLKDRLPGGRSPYAVAEVGGQLFVGTDHGAMVFDTDAGSYDTCGALPVTIGGDYASEVPNLRALDDGRLLATSGEQAVFVSEDGCASWTLLDAGVYVEYGGIGGAQDPDEAFADLYAGGDTWLVSGFQGLTWSDDGGESWTDSSILPEDYCKGVALAPGFPDNPLVLRAGYGGGPAWTSDGGLTWTGSGVGVADAYSNDITPALDFESSGVIYYAGSNDPYRSDDGGLTWKALDVPMARVRVFRPIGDEVFVLGEDATGGVKGREARSADRGETWTLMDSLSTASGQAAAREILAGSVNGEESLLVVTDQPAQLLSSADDGATWSVLYEGEAETAAGAAVWPPGEGTRLVFATASVGVLLSDDGGATWTSPSTPPTGRPRELVSPDDGSLFLVNRAGQFFRSDDGGDTWRAVGDPVGRAIFVVSVSDDFARTGSLLLGTQDGLYWSTDRAETWHHLPRYQRFEAGTHLLTCLAPAFHDGSDESCATWTDDAASLGGGWEVGHGDRLTFSFEGERFRVVGGGEGSYAVAVNGEAAGTAAPGELITLEGSGWMDVVLTAEGEGLTVDLVEVFTEGEAIPLSGDTGSTDSGGSDSGPTDSGGADSAGGDSGGGDGGLKDDGGCGCHTAGARSGAWLGLLALAALRRRKTTKTS